MSSVPLLIHLHIPKNAGTTLSRMLKVGLLMRPPINIMREQVCLGLYSVRHTEPRLRAIEALSERERRRVRFFEAHCGFGVHERLPSPNAYVTMLREPDKRLLSVFRFLKARGSIDPAASLDDFLRTEPTDPVWVVDNAQVRYLAGEHGLNDTRPIGSCTPEMLERATERLERDFLLAGLVERYDESATLLARSLGWRVAMSFTSNITAKKRVRSDEASTEAMARVAELNELDRTLYRRAATLFEEHVRSAGPGFARNEARFRAMNDRFASPVAGVLDRALTRRRLRRRAKAMRGEGAPRTDE